MSARRVIWVVPERHGGIYTYYAQLWPAVRQACRSQGLEPLDAIVMPTGEHEDAIRTLVKLKPSVIHIQHEFGLFGRKIPPFYRFPKWLRKLRQALPESRVVATAHTVIDREFRYDWKGRGKQAVARWLSNHTWVPLMRPIWMQRTWSKMDAVIVHSNRQKQAILDSGCARAEVIPHFVPTQPFGGAQRVGQVIHPKLAGIAEGRPVVLVFGYFSGEKGQAVAIEAMRSLKTDAILVLAGGARRKEDQPYLEKCRELARELGLQDQILFTDFVPEDHIDAFYRRADVVLAPFTSTSGSGSLVQAFSRGAAILTSDLPLNQELIERQPGCVQLFKASDARDLARELDALLADPLKIKQLKGAAKSYADQFPPDRIAELHAKLYLELT